MRLRGLLRSAVAGGVAFCLVLTLASCGSGRTGDQASSSTVPQRGGVLRVGITGGNSADVLDPSLFSGSAAPIPQIFEPLVFADAEGKPQFRAAESMVPNENGTVWTVTLKKGILFQDGREAKADDVINSFTRIVKIAHNGADILTGLLVDQIHKVDDYTVTIPFNHPYTSLLDSLSSGMMTVWLVPTNFDGAHPIGSGPFKLTSYEPGQLVELTRFDDYYLGPAYLDGVEVRYFADSRSQANALLSGAIDAAGQIPPIVARTVEAAGKQVLSSDSGGFLEFVMNTQIAPFDNEKVRQAFRLIVDREQIRNIVFAGKGRIGNDITSFYDPLYDASLPQRSHDIAKAKQLLAEAGHPNGLTVELRVADVQVGAIDMAQLFAQQAAAAGVTVNLRKVDVADFYADDYFQHRIPFLVDYDSASRYLPRAQQWLVTGAFFNTTAFNEPDYDALFLQAQATQDPNQLKDIAHKMQAIEYQRGGYIIPVFFPVFDAFDARVHGVVSSVLGYPFNGFQFKDLWLS